LLQQSSLKIVVNEGQEHNFLLKDGLSGNLDDAEQKHIQNGMQQLNLVCKFSDTVCNEGLE
jgi:hypothetical protein